MSIYEIINELFDYRDGNLYWKMQPRSVDMSKPAGCINPTGYRQIMINRKLYYAHRLIYLMHHPEWDITDTSKYNTINHKNQDKLNNNIKNLCVATMYQQQHDRGKQKNNTSGHKGVYWHEKAKLMRNELHKEFANHG